MATSNYFTRMSIAHRAGMILVVSVATIACGCRSPWRGMRKSDPSLDELLVTPGTWDANASASEADTRRTSPASGANRTGARANPYAMKNSLDGASANEGRDAPAEKSADIDFQEAYAAAPPHLRPLLKRQWEATHGGRASELDDAHTAVAKGSNKSFKNSESDSKPQDRTAGSEDLVDIAPKKESKPATAKSPVADNEAVRLSLNDNEETEADKAQALSPEELKPPADKKTSRQVAHSEPIDTGMREEVSVPADTSKSRGVQTALVTAESRDSSVLKASAEDSGPATAVQPAVASVAASAAPTAAVPAKDMSWHDHLREALRQLEKERENSAASPAEKLNTQAVSRMLHLSLGELEPALKPIEDLQLAEQDFFRHEFQALHDAIDPRGNPVLARRWTLVMDSQRQAINHLGAVSNLEIKNAAFCSNVDGFGSVSKFPNASFRPKQEVLLYCELENFVSQPVKDGFQTVLQGSYEIVDASGHRVFEALLSEDSDICRHQRRDYFIAYRIYMPDNLEAGRYQLRLTIEDMKGRKFGQSSLDFQIAK